MLTSKKWKHIHLRPHWDSKCILNSHFGATAGVKGKRSGALPDKSVRGRGGLESPSGCVGRAPPVRPEPRVSRPGVDSGSRWGRECSLRDEGRLPAWALMWPQGVLEGCFAPWQVWLGWHVSKGGPSVYWGAVGTKHSQETMFWPRSKLLSPSRLGSYMCNVDH